MCFVRRLLVMALSILKMGPLLFGRMEDLIAYLQGKGDKQISSAQAVHQIWHCNVEATLRTSFGIIL